MNRVVARAREAIGSALSLPLYAFSLLVPRRRDLWVFGAWFGRRYADNSRYLFEHVSANEPSIRAVWLARDRRVVEQVRRAGFEAYATDSWQGFWTSCRAGLAVLTTGIADVNRVGSSRAKRLQLWHGVPLKKIGLDDTITMNPSRSPAYRVAYRTWRFVCPFVRERWDALISTSPAVSTRLASAFGAHDSQVLVTGYPRHDAILRPDPPPIPVLEELKWRWSATKLVCYAPTHRQQGRERLDLFEGLDIEELERCLARHNAVLVVKLHFYHRTHAPFANAEDSRIYAPSDEECPDLNALLPHSDVLITDYSSVFIDYLLLDRPMLFAPFDREHYLGQDREHYEPYDAATPGRKVETWPELIRALGEELSGSDAHAAQRREAHGKYLAFNDTGNAQRVTAVAQALVAQHAESVPVHSPSDKYFREATQTMRMTRTER